MQGTTVSGLQSLSEDELISVRADDQIGLASHAGTG